MNKRFRTIRIALAFRWPDIRYCLRRPRAFKFMWQVIAIELNARETVC